MFIAYGRFRFTKHQPRLWLHDLKSRQTSTTHRRFDFEDGARVLLRCKTTVQRRNLTQSTINLCFVICFFSLPQLRQSEKSENNVFSVQIWPSHTQRIWHWYNYNRMFFVNNSSSTLPHHSQRKRNADTIMMRCFVGRMERETEMKRLLNWDVQKYSFFFTINFDPVSWTSKIKIRAELPPNRNREYIIIMRLPLYDVRVLRGCACMYAIRHTVICFCFVVISISLLLFNIIVWCIHNGIYGIVSFTLYQFPTHTHTHTRTRELRATRQASMRVI